MGALARALSTDARPATALGIVFSALPVLAVYSFESVAALLFLGAAASLTRESLASVGRWLRGPVGLVLGLLWLWLAVSALWSPAPLQSLAKVAGVGLHIGAGLVLAAAAGRLSPARRARVALFVTGAVGTVALIFLIEAASGAPLARWAKGIALPPGGDLQATIDHALTKISRASGVLLTLAAAGVLLAGLRRGARLTALALALGAAAAILVMPNDTAKLGLGAGLVAAAAATLHPRLTLRALGLGIAAAILVLPWAIEAGLLMPLDAALRGLKMSAAHRFDIYHYVAGLIAERPFAGYGFDAARHLGASAPRFEMPGLGHAPSLLPLHPHNAMLQIWLEAGLPGALLAAGLVHLLFGALLRRPWTRPEAAATAFTLTAGLALLSLGYGLWQYHWLAALLIAATALRLALARE